MKSKNLEETETTGWCFAASNLATRRSVNISTGLQTETTGYCNAAATLVISEQQSTSELEAESLEMASQGWQSTLFT